VVAIDVAKRAAAFDAGLAASAAHGPARLAKQSVRAVTNEAEGLLADTTTLTDVYKGGGSPEFRCGSRSARRCSRSPRCSCSGRCSSTMPGARLRERTGKQAEPGSDPPLLNEMGNLADGDLTVQASVTEDVTGAIADSINFTIEELRTWSRASIRRPIRWRRQPRTPGHLQSAV
jgi:hypothetical protein